MKWMTDNNCYFKKNSCVGLLLKLEYFQTHNNSNSILTHTHAKVLDIHFHKAC